MPLGTLERSAPPFFRQGPSALSRLAVLVALSVFLMVADTRFQISGLIRQTVGTVIYPLQWLMLQPVEFAGHGSSYFRDLKAAQTDADQARRKMAELAERAGEAELLALENERLRELLSLKNRLKTPSQAAEVVYDTADPFTRRVVLDRGQLAGIEPGSPVLDESGVLGQVTRVFPLSSEVTLLIDRDQAIPILNLRTGSRGVAYGDPVAGHGGGMELRFMPANADIQEGDLLTTSGVDGVYPPGLPVAKVVKVERSADSAFARIYCTPVSRVHGVRHVMVLKPASDGTVPRPEPAPVAPSRKGRKS